ncbi:MAG: hypothetical protein K2I90_03800 [Odoribacter sp.]|nr:hypothetical protein [Odoribacter sp.]
MEKRILFIAFWLCNFIGIMAQTQTSSSLEKLDSNPLSLSLELVKPNGKLDRDAYFLARLKNLNDSLAMLTVSSQWRLHTRMEAYCQEVGGKEYGSNPRTFFDFEAQGVIKIKASGEYVAKFPLFRSSTLDEGNGLLPSARRVVRQVRKVCLKIRNFKCLPELDPVSVEHLYEMLTVDLQSNWVEIDGEAFAKLMTWER